jgi:signal transduction histidine kinase
MSNVVNKIKSIFSSYQKSLLEKIKENKKKSQEIIEFNKTLQKRIKKELEINNKQYQQIMHQSKLAQMGEMISMIAHQWRQPLTAISASSNDLILKIMLDNYDKNYFNDKLEKVTDLSQHLSKTIDDFRGFYKEDKEAIEILYSTIVKGALDIVSISIENKNIKLTTDFNCKKKISTYPNELRQVVLNLIKNAEDILLDNNISNPYINIKTYDDDKYSYLEVSDNGGGIPSNIINKIFEPYFSTKKEKDGTGLGLYMSKTIIEEHCDGKLTVSNSADGAVFCIKIPVVKGD